MIVNLTTPIKGGLPDLKPGDQVEISGYIYTARDAIMPKIVRMIKNKTIDNLPVYLAGAAVMHTAVSSSGFGPTSTNKVAIESAMGLLSEAGVKIHIGKGVIKQDTIDQMSNFGAIYVVTPPVSALFQDRMLSKKIVAFQKEGIEALYELQVSKLPGIVAAANKSSIFNK